MISGVTGVAIMRHECVIGSPFEINFKNKRLQATVRGVREGYYCYVCACARVANY